MSDKIRHFVIPEIFFKKIAEKGKLCNGMYSRLWLYWLSEFVDEIFEPDFVEKQIKTFPKVSEIKEIYHFGVQLLQQDFKILEKSKKKPQKHLSKEVREVAQQVLIYLNEKAGSTFQLTGGKNLELIADRMKDGFSISDFKLVIDNKVYDWRGTDRETYLRPITLFSKTKFENYLNGVRKTSGEKPVTKFDQLADSVGKAAELIKLRTHT